MCTHGVNYSQLKISIHQLIEQGRLYGKSLEQWEHVTGHLGSEFLSEELKKAQEDVAGVISSLESILGEVNRLSREESVTISSE
ncbi:MAG: hypothetical protein QMD08_00470 [Actinomycetota bacterium]|nr:hypothetical protein [Actinomycetota bacterium]